MRRTMAKASFYTATNLLIFALVGTVILAFTYDLTHDTIQRSIENEKLKLISQIAPVSTYDNNIMQDTIKLPADALLGSTTETIAYRGRMQGQPSIAVLESIAPDGYSGKINLIVAIKQDGSLGGVRVVAHKETPGLGDYIEIAKGNWITGFNGTSLQTHSERDWKVKKDGGKFDYMAGATITPRAIVKAVHKTLLYYQKNQQQIFAQK